VPDDRQAAQDTLSPQTYTPSKTRTLVTELGAKSTVDIAQYGELYNFTSGNNMLWRSLLKSDMNSPITTSRLDDRYLIDPEVKTLSDTWCIFQDTTNVTNRIP